MVRAGRSAGLAGVVHGMRAASASGSQTEHPCFSAASGPARGAASLPQHQATPATSMPQVWVPLLPPLVMVAKAPQPVWATSTGWAEPLPPPLPSWPSELSPAQHVGGLCVCCLQEYVQCGKHHLPPRSSSALPAPSSNPRGLAEQPLCPRTPAHPSTRRCH